MLFLWSTAENLEYLGKLASKQLLLTYKMQHFIETFQVIVDDMFVYGVHNYYIRIRLFV